LKYLIISDIHGNLPALESIIKRERNIFGYINLGDVVNYGPWSNECVELINELNNTFNIIGNHEEYFIKGKCSVENDLVKSFFNQTYPNFRYYDIIKNYKKSINFMNFQIRHNFDNKKYIFKDTDLVIKENLIIGHSHQQYFRNINNKLLINPGSVGQNRKLINVSNYIVWNLEKNTFDLKKNTFDLRLIINEMKIKKYPKECIDYYKSKNII